MALLNVKAIAVSQNKGRNRGQLSAVSKLRCQNHWKSPLRGEDVVVTPGSNGVFNVTLLMDGVPVEHGSWSFDVICNDL